MGNIDFYNNYHCILPFVTSLLAAFVILSNMVRFECSLSKSTGFVTQPWPVKQYYHPDD